jgi:cell division ATPase FtsA
MGIFSMFSKRKKEKVLLIDIGSGSVTVSIAIFSNDVPMIVANLSSDIPVLPDVDLSAFEQAMKNSLDAMFGKMREAHMLLPDRIRVHLSSPWFASQVRTAKMSRPAPFVVSKTLMNDMLARELKSFEDEEMAKEAQKGEPVRVLESKTLQVKLNGYPTVEPIGLSTRELEFSMFVSVASERLVKMIEESIGHEFPHTPVTFGSFLGASFLVVRDLFPHTTEYLLADIGGEVTDLSLVRDGSLVQTVSFPKGRNFIVRRLAEGLNRTLGEAVTLCTLYVEGKVEEGVKDTCDRILTEAKNEWLASFQTALFSVSNELSIPDTILLTVSSDVAPWFTETIRREEFHQYTLTEKEFKVVLLNAEFFHEALSFNYTVERNPFIMIEALATERLSVKK